MLLAEYRCREEGCLLWRAWQSPAGICYYVPPYKLSDRRAKIETNPKARGRGPPSLVQEPLEHVDPKKRRLIPLLLTTAGKHVRQIPITTSAQSRALDRGCRWADTHVGQPLRKAHERGVACR